MAYSMALRDDMKYEKPKKKLMHEKYPQYEDTLKGHMKMMKDVALTALKGGTPVEPPKKKKR